MPRTSPKDTIPIAEVARRVDRSELTIRRWIAAGQFPGYRIGNSYVIPTEWYERWTRGDWRPAQDTEAA